MKLILDFLGGAHDWVETQHSTILLSVMMSFCSFTGSVTKVFVAGLLNTTNMASLGVKFSQTFVTSFSILYDARSAFPVFRVPYLGCLAADTESHLYIFVSVVAVVDPVNITILQMHKQKFQTVMCPGIFKMGQFLNHLTPARHSYLVSG